ncbi:pyridoxamine 5'-phosphate oxidase [Lactiplantibacillus sp. WILCCON 0030]|uniref:Pyridoxamine 5'-phosphate oxidase n=1 Tax=Lactiplantibacillus brownii TaxID=3069269 RepID=A0ABU1A540_9LACO|nr:pyridoxamine 5'-phosphate oxidase [Lactiplantibacillus brownii]MDQ7936094.1 pyridoxamine 5'-phosphate oxidase [Lactiplantibacillus brownii]
MDLTTLQHVVTMTNKIALSTALDNQADVKIVNFVWYPAQPATLYFSSVKDSAALTTYAQNPDVAFISVPNDTAVGNPYIRAQHVKLERSEKTMAELLPRYLETVPNYQKVWDLIGPKLVVFELKLKDLYVDPGLGQNKGTMHF